MEPIEWLLVIALIWGGGEHVRAEHHKDNAEEYQEQAEQLAVVADENAETAKRAAEAAENNAELVKSINDDLNQCVATVEKYRLVESEYRATNENMAADLEALESRLADSDLSQCRVPGWLVDEIAGD
jgi:methyl-accepting chemotaxis protein